MIQSTRIQKLNEVARRKQGDFILYWMQEAQRCQDNQALELAIRSANKYGVTVVVCFGIMDSYPEANERHYAFMLEGLADVAQGLRSRGIAFIVRRGMPGDTALALSQNATAVICERSYMPNQVRWRRQLAEKASCPVIQVETEVVVPINVVSDKSEYAARTIRPKIHRVWDEYIIPMAETELHKPSDAFEFESDFDVTDTASVLSQLNLDRSVTPVSRFKGGETEAQILLDNFVTGTVDGYADGHNEPSSEKTSFLSPYLNFGQISPVAAAVAARGTDTGSNEDRTSFIEELIIRRELAINYIAFDTDFSSYGALPGWARKTLAEHAHDEREYIYSMVELEACNTHDQHWNDAMREMVHTGFMHNYMRMYWAKKILEWSPTPECAFATTIALNNKYFLDGRGPNSYANVAWCFGLHDRAWTERPIFGKIRYMNANGLNRKFDMPAYTAFVDALVASEQN